MAEEPKSDKSKERLPRKDSATASPEKKKAFVTGPEKRSKNGDRHSRHASKKHLEVVLLKPSEASSAETSENASHDEGSSASDAKPQTREQMIQRILELREKEIELKKENSELSVQIEEKKKAKAKLTEKAPNAKQDGLPKFSELQRKKVPLLLKKENLTHREKIVCEILTTEQAYLTALSVLDEIYYKGVNTFVKANPNQIADEDIANIFSNLANLKVLNTQFCEKLEDRLEEWDQPGKDHLSDLFKDHARVIQGSYCTFGRAYEDGTKIYRRLHETNPAFKKLFEQLDAHVGTGLKFESYLIQAVQRVPRYCLLIRDFLKATPESNYDYKDLTEAGEKMDKVGAAINLKIKANELVVKFNAVVNRKTAGFSRLKTEPVFEGRPEERIWQKDGEVALLVDLNDIKRSYKGTPELLLFGDCLVAASFLNSKVPIQEVTVPTKVMWITQTLTERDQAIGTEAECKFLLKVTGPEQSWLIGFKTNADRLTWQEIILKQMGVLVTGMGDAHTGKRKGMYAWKGGKGTYNGEWSEAKMHGTGKLVSEDGSFSGLWDSNSRSGFGETHLGLSGWKDLGDSVVAQDPHLFWKGDQLLDRDWQLIVVKGKTTAFPKGELVITQGKKNTRLIKLVKGELAIEKVGEPGTPPVLVKVLAVEPGKQIILGESAVIPEMQQATANVRAHTDIEVIEVDIKLLFNIFASEPGVAMRFYRWVAQNLSEKIRQSHGESKVVAKTEDSESSDDVSANNRVKIQEQKKGGKPAKKEKAPKPTKTESLNTKFSLQSNEVLLKSSPAKLHGLKNKAGDFYVFSNTLIFEYEPMFGSALHDTIPIDLITSINGDEKSEELKIETKHKKYRLTVTKDFSSVFVLIGNLYADSQKAEEQEVLTTSAGKPQSLTASEVQTRGGHPPMNRALSKSNIPRKLAKTDVPEQQDLSFKMTADDWDRLIEGNAGKATATEFRKGDRIVQEGKKHQKIYQIKKGTCDISRDTPEGPQHIVTLPQGAVFGELTFLHPKSQQATASVIAGCDCEINIIEGAWINLLMVDYPEMGGRFYNHLCSILATRLSEREKDMQAEKEKQANKKAKAETTETK